MWRLRHKEASISIPSPIAKVEEDSQKGRKSQQQSSMLLNLRILSDPQTPKPDSG